VSQVFYSNISELAVCPSCVQASRLYYDGCLSPPRSSCSGSS